MTGYKMSSAVLYCLNCKREYDLQDPLWKCSCGGILDLYHPKPHFSLDHLSGRPPGLWRYRETIPLLYDSNIITLGEPLTPLLPVGQPGLFFKLDYMMPTGSYKDRGAAVLLSKAKELGIREIIEDSSGNAGAAIAAYAARAGINCSIFIPASTSPGKVRQIELYGVELVQVEGVRADAAKAAFEAARTTYYASHYWNPYFLEGTKTTAFEIWEQLGQKVPDTVITPVGHGTMLLGLYKGFSYLARAGVVDRLPRIYGLQTGACAPLAKMFQDNLTSLPEIQPRPTLAEGVSISAPIRWPSILEAVTQTNGAIIAVNDSEILASLHFWARRGILMEPTSATATAGYSQLIADNLIEPGELTVVIITGTGVKTAGLLHAS